MSGDLAKMSPRGSKSLSTARFALASCLLMFDVGNAQAASTCNSETTTGRTVCFEQVTFPHIRIPFVASIGTWQFTTSDLANLPGHSNTVDTMMWLLNTDTNMVVQIDNDSGGGFSSRIIANVTTQFNAMLLVAARVDDRQGRTGVAFHKNGVMQPSLSKQDHWFGGWRRTDQSVKTGDRMFVGFPRAGAFYGLLANSLFVLENTATSCTSNCGAFSQGSYDAGTLAQLTLPFTDASAAIMVGGYFDQSQVGTRWFHSRLGSGWTGSSYADSDCDGLTYQIEGLTSTNPNLNVNSCDSANGPSPDCAGGRRFKQRVEKSPFTQVWSASDTDNDGMRDDWELYGSAWSCSAVPAQPYPSPGTCRDVTYKPAHGACLAVVPFPQYATTNPLSMLDPDIREYDSFVQLTGHTSTSLAAKGALQQFLYVFEEEGLECNESDADPSTCPGDVGEVNLIRTHQFPMTVPLEQVQVQGGTWLSQSHFNKTMPESRRVTRIFDHIFLREDQGGGENVGRVATVAAGSTNSTYIANTTAHEHGHQLGLRHMADNTGNPNGCADKVLNYPSLMNYRWCGGSPAKADSTIDNDLWYADLGQTCSVPGDCPESGNCVNNKCSPCGNAEARLSRGLMPNLSESAPGVNEAGIPTRLAGWMACDTCYNQTPGFEGWPVACSGSPSEACSADWNRNGIWTDSGVQGLNNYDFNCNIGEVVKDESDWSRIYATGKASLDVMRYGFVRLFGSNLNSLAPADLSPWSATVSVPAAVSLTSSISGYGTAFSWSGACAGCSNAAVASGVALSALGPLPGADIDKGARIDFFVQVASFPSPVGVQPLVSNGMFEIVVANSTKRVAAYINPGGGMQVAASNATILTAGVWYWVSLSWRRDNGLARLTVVPWNNGTSSWNYSSATCTSSVVARTADVATPTTWFGDTQSGLWTGTSRVFNGKIDQPHIWNSARCVWNPAVEIEDVICSGGMFACD